MSTITIYSEMQTNYGVELDADDQRKLDAELDRLTRERLGAAFPGHDVEIVRNIGGFAPGSSGSRTVDAPDGVDADDVREIVGRVWREVCERYEEIVSAAEKRDEHNDDATARAVERLAAALFEANDNSLGAPWAGESDDVRRWYMEQARALLRELGLVAVPRDLVEAVERTSAECDGELADEQYIGTGEYIGVATPYAEACEALAKAVVTQLRVRG